MSEKKVVSRRAVLKDNRGSRVIFTGSQAAIPYESQSLIASLDVSWRRGLGFL
jgi:hypothetical protein